MTTAVATKPAQAPEADEQPDQSPPVDPQSPPTPAQTPDAPVPTVESRYADERTAEEVARRVKAAREAGFSRTRLTDLTELGGSALWRAEGGRVHKHEVEQLVAVLDRIESGELEPPSRGKVSEVDAKIKGVLAILVEGGQNPKLTKAELVDVIQRAHDALAA